MVREKLTTIFIALNVTKRDFILLCYPIFFLGPDSQTDSGSEHSVHDKDASDENIGLGRDKKEVVSDEKLLVCHL